MRQDVEFLIIHKREVNRAMDTHVDTWTAGPSGA